MQIGVEIGGTFTDLVCLVDGRLTIVKVMSTPRRPEQAATSALRQAAGCHLDAATVVHGSTVATNAVLERKGTRVALAVTRGFGDLMRLQRQDRANPYVLKYLTPAPVVGDRDVYELDERTTADGGVLRPLSISDVEAMLADLEAEGIRSLAVCFLHSYRNPEHERAVRRFAARLYPKLLVTLSHEITPEYREYERASTTVLSSYVRPVIDDYLGRFEATLESRAFEGDLHVMQSNGGALPAPLIRRHAVRTLLSGPAGGITAAKFVAGQLGLPNLLTFDMGGTSTDVCLITDGRAEIRSDTEIGGLPIRVPMLDIVTVGAGGGSIASVDRGGKLRVGPQSAGAVPGPACYGAGGELATITDANVVAGVIRPDASLAAAIAVRRDLAEAACARLGERLGTTAAGAAAAILEVANATMRGALRLISTQRGVDPAGYWLLSYGGAGGQHAVPLAENLGLKGVIVPRLPGLFSAFGLLIADVERDWSASLITEWPLLTADALNKTILDMCAQARSEFAGAGLPGDEMGYQAVLAMRYRGQAFEVDVPLGDWGGPIDLTAVAEAFHATHERRYGHAARSAPVELVTVRVKATLPRRLTLPPPDRSASRNAGAGGMPGRALPGTAYVHRDDITDAVAGPVVIEEATSTTWVPAGWTARVEEHGHLMITRSERG